MSSRSDARGTDESVVLTYAESPLAAETIVALLEANGVHSYAAHRRLEDVFPTIFSHDGTAVIVLAGDLEQARSILAADIDEPSHAADAESSPDAST